MADDAQNLGQQPTAQMKEYQEMMRARYEAQQQREQATSDAAPPAMPLQAEAPSTDAVPAGKFCFDQYLKLFRV